MTLNKIALLMAVAISPSLAFAVDADVTPGTAQTVTYDAESDGATVFVQTDFQFTVSQNVGLISDENANLIAVGTWNTKGRNAYAGSSNGGSVSTCGEPTTGATEPQAPTLDLEDETKGGCGTTAAE